MTPANTDAAAWLHPICRQCYALTHVHPLPAQGHAPRRVCCFCGAVQTDGLVLHAEPLAMPCHGKHTPVEAQP